MRYWSLMRMLHCPALEPFSGSRRFPVGMRRSSSEPALWRIRNILSAGRPKYCGMGEIASLKNFCGLPVRERSDHQKLITHGVTVDKLNHSLLTLLPFLDLSKVVSNLCFFYRLPSCEDGLFLPFMHFSVIRSISMISFNFHPAALSES